MDSKRLPGVPPQACSPSTPVQKGLERLQDVFVTPAKRMVNTTVSDEVYRVMVATKGGISGFWEDAITSFDGDLEALVLAAVAVEEDRKRAHQTSVVRSASGRVRQELYDRVIKLEHALVSIKRMSKSKVMAGLAKLLLQKRGLWIDPLN